MVPSPMQRGWEAAKRWAWEEARAAFQESVNDCETPEALEGLGTAALWLDDVPAALGALERAYRLYRDAGDDEAGARVAATIADGLLTFRGEPAVAAGWLARARSCLRGDEGAPIAASIDALEAFLAMAHERDVTRALSLGEAAVQRSRRLGETDLEMVSQAIHGVILVSSGRLHEGMRLLDEATTAVVAGDVKDPYAAVNVCCALVTACVRVRDYSRLAQWARNAMEISREWPDRALFSYPRTEHAMVLIELGGWAEAERELRDIMDDNEGRPRLSRLAMLRLAELRRRQGRVSEARDLLRRLAAEQGRIGFNHLSEAVAAAVALDEGDAVRAADLAERYLRAVPADDVVERADGLEVLLRARIALGELDAASEVSDELHSIAAMVPTAALRAAARAAAGSLASAHDDHASARTAFEDAVDLYEGIEASFDAARARVELARSLLALGLPDAAGNEARQALRVFEELGAANHIKATSGLLGGLRDGADRDRRGISLTQREIEVLRLVATGRSNEEIAGELVLSVRTVERHISNVYSKIGAYGHTARAVATAYAHTHALV